MFVGMWMTRDLLTVEPNARLETAAVLMKENRIRRLPVVSTAEGVEKLVGILSSTDIARAAGNTDVTVESAMTADPLTTTADAPIEGVAAIMRERKIGALPVLRSGELVGLITESDVFKAFTSLFDLSAPGARITFDISAGEDVFPFVAELADKHGLRITSFASLHDHYKPMCVLHVVGEDTEALLEDIWRSHHRVENIIHTGVVEEEQKDEAAES